MNAAALEARRLVRACDGGTLSTLSRRHAGYPFGSVVPYVADAAAAPIVLVSRIAEHTRNLLKDPRASLLVHGGGQDLQAAARVTLLARAEQSPEPYVAERYLRYKPAAQRLVELGDFIFVRLKPVAIRYIGGFGSIHWIDESQYAPPGDDMERDGARILTALEMHHADALRRLSAARLPADGPEARLVGVDCDGFDMRSDDVRLRFDFPGPVAGSAEFERALLAMAAA